MEHCGRALLLTVLLSGAASIFGQSISQADVDHIAKHLDVKYDVLTNFAITPQLAQDIENTGIVPPPLFWAQVQITNKGSTPMMNKPNWEIYFCHIFMIEPELFDIASSQYRGGGLFIQEAGVVISFVKGCLFKIAPSSMFGALNVNETRNVTFRAQHWSVARTDKMPNWYVVAPGLEPKLIQSTVGESLDFVGLHDTPFKWKRVLPEDIYDPLTPIHRFHKNNDTVNNKNLAKLVIPTPLEMKIVTHKTIVFDPTWEVYAKEPELQDIIMILKEHQPGLRPTSKMVSKNGIVLQIGPVNINGSFDPEAYSLKVNTEANRIDIKGQTSTGVFYGVQTLLSLLENSNTLPDITIKDKPRFGFRGLHVDVARNFQTVQEIQKLLKAMAMYKLNKLHLHLSDDEAWRLQIPDLEELTEVGSKQCHDLTETTCLLPQLGSAPDSSPAGAKFYTVNDYKAILKTAKKLQVEVIPEFDFPGRARAAVIAMEARYKKYQAVNQIKALQYRLRDPLDTSVYISRTFFNDGALNPCMISTYNFIGKVITEVVNMHKGIQPLTTLHFGGDDAPLGVWVNSPVCQALFGNKPVNALELKKHFSTATATSIYQKNLTAAAWEDGVLTAMNTPFNRTNFTGPIQVNAWHNIWEQGFANRAYRLANANYKVILSSATHLFFDHPSEPDPRERGYYWGPRYTDSRKVFKFLPQDIYANADETRFGALINKQHLCAQFLPCDPLNATQNIIGMQAQLWSEVIRNGEQLESQAFPRVIVFAERAWHKGAWEDDIASPSALPLLYSGWANFSNAIGHKELGRLDKMGIKYRVAPPGVRLIKDELLTNTEFPGLTVELSFDRRKWHPLSEFVNRKVWPIYLRTKSVDGSRTSRSVIMAPELEMAVAG